jgi:tyrosinase
MTSGDQPVANPTWMADIRNFFTPTDIACMSSMGIDLATYDGVKANAIRIFGVTEPPDASMPKGEPKWSQARWDTFKNWIVNGYPYGTVAPIQLPALSNPSAQRIRKDVSTLSQDEINKLITAFKGILALPITDPNSYFIQAGIHWLPAHPDFYCLHHENRYNPWHRMYMISFENALRSVPGCEDVTLPYWNITTQIPDFLYDPNSPFLSYTLPTDIGASPFLKGYTTSRYSASDVLNNVNGFGIPALISQALSQSKWLLFDSPIISAHDNGHGATGQTMGWQDVAAYDPIFWFFHANWDRLWWKWQQTVNATTLNGFLTTVTGDTSWLKIPPFNSLPPFTQTADQTIDLSTYGIDYEHPASEQPPPPQPEAFGSLPADALRGIHPSDKASVRIKGINRLNIPGTFVVHLQADGTTVARQAFFQARNPRSCAACVEKGVVDLDMLVDLDAIRGKPLNVVIEPLGPDAPGRVFPLSSAGDPTVNVRLPLM